MSAPRSSSSFARILVVCGVAVALTAATVGSAFFGVQTWLTLVPLAGGAAAALAGFVAGMRHARVDPRALRLGFEIAAAVVVVVAANALTLHAPAILDVTRAKKNTLSEASVQIAKGLPSPVVVRTTLAADDRAYIELAELVDRYARINPSITLERISATRDPEAARAFGDEKVLVVRDVAGDAGAVRQKVRFVAGSPDQEEQLTNALRAVSSGTRPRVYFLAGHGEASVADDGPGGARRFGQALVDEGLDVVPLPLVAAGGVPDDAAAVIIAGPSSSIADAERALLQKYLDGGGRLLLLLEPHAEPLAGLLGSVGVQANDDVVIDGSSLAGLLGPESATGVAYAAHPVTQKLGGALTHFVRARSLSENPGTPATVVALVQTGAEAFGETRLEPGVAPSFDDADIKGPLTMMMAASVSVDAPAAAAPAGATGNRATARSARVVVAGDSTFASNQGLGLGANRDLAVNAVLWLVEREGSIAVRPRGRGGDLLLLTPTARERIAFVLLYGLPVALLCAGLAISGVRRRR